MNFFENLSHLIGHDLAADHARVTSEMRVENAILHRRLDALEKQITNLRADLASNASAVLKSKKAR